MTVTIREVAQRLKLSITTVSRALDGYDDVAERTRQRVIQAAREMGYVPSRAARQLRRKRADTIGFILPVSQPRYSDPFFSEVIAGLGDEAAVHNLDLLVSLAPPGRAAERAAYLRWQQGRRVDGLILTRLRLKDWRTQHLLQTGFPFVAFGRTRGPMKFPYIGVDGAAGMRQLVAHLAALGHRRIGFVSGPARLMFQADRMAGYQAGLKAAALPFEASLVASGDLTRAGGYRAGRQLLSLPRPPTAIIGVNDLSAIGVMRAAQELGRVVGRDLAVAGFDGLEETAHTQPPLTTLDQHVYDIARRLGQMLVQVIADKPLAEPQVLLRPELVVRASTAG